MPLEPIAFRALLHWGHFLPAPLPWCSPLVRANGKKSGEETTGDDKISVPFSLMGRRETSCLFFFLSFFLFLSSSSLRFVSSFWEGKKWWNSGISHAPKSPLGGMQWITVQKKWNHTRRVRPVLEFCHLFKVLVLVFF
jgi:hypothetical protein